MESPGSLGDMPPKLTGVICTGDSFVTCSTDGIVESVYPIHPTTSGDQCPDRSHLKRSSSEGVKKLIDLEIHNEDEEGTWDEDDGDDVPELWLPNGMSHYDVTEATGNVDDILDILGVKDSPPPRKRGRKKKSDDGNAENGCSDRSVVLDSDQIEGSNGFLWDTIPQPRTSLLNENSRTFDPGPTGEALDAIDPIECFKLFVTDQMMDLMISATNGSIDAETSKRTRRSQDCHFQPVGADEFSAMLGLVILSGALQNNHLRTELLFDSTFCGDQFRATMPCSRFSILLNVLSFEDSETVKQQSSHNKFIPISKLWNSLIENCGKWYVPGSHVTIGKQIVPFRGHGCPFIVTTHSPVKHGIQVFHMVDNSSKYIINAFPYLGRNTLPKDCPVENFAVNCLVDPIKNSYRNVTMDEWFTSISLAEELLSEAKLTVIGQIKNNKKELPEFFNDFKYKQRKSGSSIFLHAGNVTAVSYKPCNNTGLISLISTCHNGLALRNSSGKPQIVLDYEATRGAVDSLFENNKMTTSRKTYRWPLAMFYLIIDVAVQNSYVIYYHNFLKHRQDSKTKVLTKLDFALSLVRQMCNAWMRARLEMPIPAALRSMICRCLSINEPRLIADNDEESSSSASRLVIDAKNKVLAYSTEKDQLVLEDKCRQYCWFCPSKTKRKTRWLCGSCRKTICIEHSRRMCVPCWENFRKRSEK